MPNTAERIAALKNRVDRGGVGKKGGVGVSGSGEKNPTKEINDLRSDTKVKKTATTAVKKDAKDRAKPKAKPRAKSKRKARPGSKAALSYGQRAFVDLYVGGPDAIRGNGTACYRFLHPRANESTCATEACKYLILPKIKKYLDEKAQLLSEKTTMNAARVLEESIQMLAMAKGLLPQIHEFVVTVKNAETGADEQVIAKNELCVTNLAMMAKAIELIGRNVGVRAFEDSVNVNHTGDLERMLNDRGKALEAGARERMKLVSND